MLVRALFAAFVLLALLGDARIFLFVMNRVVFGSHREEKSPWHWLMWTVPPVLLALTALFWPLNQWIDRLFSVPAIERLTPERIAQLAWTLTLAKIGVGWLIVAGAVWRHLLDPRGDRREFPARAAARRNPFRRAGRARRHVAQSGLRPRSHEPRGHRRRSAAVVRRLPHRLPHRHA